MKLLYVKDRNASNFVITEAAAEDAVNPAKTTPGHNPRLKGDAGVVTDQILILINAFPAYSRIYVPINYIIRCSFHWTLYTLQLLANNNEQFRN